MAENPAKRICPSHDAENVPCMGETDIELDAFYFTWAINNYSVLGESAELVSPTFFGGPKSKYGWKLRLVPKNKIGTLEYASLHLELLLNGNWLGLRVWECPPVKAHFQMSILNADGEPTIDAFQKKPIYEFTKSNNSWGQTRVISSEALVDPTRRLVVNDTLKILCKIWIHGERKEKVMTCKRKFSDEQKTKVCRDRFATDFGKMFKESIATDCTVSTGKASFKAHKAILSARSSVFAALFTANMKEKEMTTVQIADFDNEVVKGMLEHLYTGDTTLMTDRAQELLQIAEKYNLEGLKEDCENTISDNLSKENVVGILLLAHNHNAAILKSHVISFINSRHMIQCCDFCNAYFSNKEELLKMKSFQDAVKAHSQSGPFADVFLSSK